MHFLLFIQSFIQSYIFGFQGVAEELGEFHPRHYRRVQDQRVIVPEQHGHPEAAQRGGLRLQLRSDDSDKSKTLEGLDVFPVLRGELQVMSRVRFLN